MALDRLSPIKKIVTINVNENINKYKDSIILQNYYLDPCYMYDNQCKQIPLSFATQNENIYDDDEKINKLKNITIKSISYIYFGYMRNITKTILFILILYMLKLIYDLSFY